MADEITADEVHRQPEQSRDSADEGRENKANSHTGRMPPSYCFTTRKRELLSEQD